MKKKLKFIDFGQLIKKGWILTLLILLFSSYNSDLIAQSVKITGKVTNASGDPIAGVTIIVKGTTNGTVTSSDGNYSLSNVNSNASLVFSFVGMTKQEIPVNGRTEVDVSLIEEAIGLNDVVVIGYGTIKKRDLTGSMSSVKSDVITAFPTTTIDQALQGRMSGVQVVQNNGKPGANMQIRIRGTNSINGDNSPLWIIDGFPGNEQMINMSDVESVEVLKDASSTAIYGSRGANGVIIVTTKKGKAGATRIDYEGSYSIQTLRKKLDLMNAADYMRLNNIQQLNDKGVEYFTQDQINSAGKGTDWQDLMFRTAPASSHSLTVSGGNEKTQFSIGGSYFDQKGILINDDGYQRISLRANVNHDISKILSISYNVILSRIDQDTKNSSGSPFSTALSGVTDAAPTLDPYKNDGSYTILKTAYPFSYDGLTNPVMYAKEISNKLYSNNAVANLAFTIKPIEDLSIKISGNVLNQDSRSDNYTPTTYYGSVGDASIGTIQSLNLNSDNIVTYQKTINDDHNITVTGALTYEQNVTTSLGASGSGFLSDNYETYNIGAASTINTPTSGYSKWALLSYLGRVNYSYKGKYLATVSFRSDGSSRYSEGSKWGYFPSGALAWRISEEDFMKNIKFISNLKLRGGYGETGSTAINPYSTLSILSTGKTVFDKALYTFFAPSSTYPGDLKWETTAQTDIGVDVGFLKNRINLTADYYIKNTKDLLNPVQLPRSTGYTNTIMNIGEVQNKGLEIQLDAKVIDKVVQWDISTNISVNRNKVVKLYNGADITGSSFGVTIIQDYINLVREGEPLGVFYGYREDGYDATGKIVYKDLKEDGIISTADKTIIGNPNPKFIYSLNSTVSYKNFELSWFIQGSQGNDIYGLSMAKNYYYGIGLNMFKEVLDNHWTPETPNAKYPKISSSSTSLKMSDRFVYDGSYVRLKNIQLAYNLPVDKLGIKWMRNGQVYVSFQNLLTLASYPYWDPEVNSAGGGNSINQGIDYFTYPTAKSITFGLKAGF
jgi:TonB-dependent starch-binding outer membrane protein SusC